MNMKQYRWTYVAAIISLVLFLGTGSIGAQNPVEPVRTPTDLLDDSILGPPLPMESLAQTQEGLWNPQLLESFFDGVIAVQLEQYSSPGAMVAVVKDGNILMAKGYGYADQEQGIPVDGRTTMFRPGSNSKLFVWTAVMQLVEQGKLELHEPIAPHLDFEIPTQLRDGRPGGEITMYHLMTHTAGFEDVMSEVFVETEAMVRPLGEYLQDVPERIYPVGEFSVYSNYGSSLAAYVVEQITEQPFAQYVDQHIFEPLAMEYSTFAQPIPDHLQGQMALGYLYQNGQAVPAEFEWVQSYPAGGLSSSAHDMAVFMLAHLGGGSYGGGTILQPDTVAVQHAQAFTQDPRLPGMTLGFIEGSSHGQEFLAHGGDTLQMHTGLWLFPEENLGLYMSYNGAATVWARLVALQAFMNRYFPEHDGSPVWANGEEDITDAYTGAYLPARSNYSGFEALLRLVQPLMLSSAGPDELSAGMMGTQRIFKRTNEGLWASEDGSVAFAAAYDEKGQAERLFFGDPMPYVRAVWYESPMFTFPLVGGGVLWFVLFFIHWLRRWFRRNGRDEYARRWRLWLPMVAYTLALGGLLFLGARLALDGSEVYGLPRLFFTPKPNLFRWISGASAMMAVSAILLLLSGLAAWVRPRTRLRDKIYYTASGVWAVGLVWFLYFTNLFTW